MKINCLHCGHKQDLGDAYDDYEGLIRCPTCAGLLDIRSVDGQMKACRPGSMQARHTPEQHPPAAHAVATQVVPGQALPGHTTATPSVISAVESSASAEAERRVS